MRPDYCPIGGEPCQSVCADPCTVTPKPHDGQHPYVRSMKGCGHGATHQRIDAERGANVTDTALLLEPEREAWPAVLGHVERTVVRPGGTQHGWTTTDAVSAMLREHHYLGPLRRGVAWVSEAGCIVLARPTARGVPAHWLELSRWCLLGRKKNAGSTQWAQFVRDVRKRYPECTTIVSYSDPSAGHDGALYRACNWWWAPTWLRLRPPPSGNGSWRPGEVQAVKDRWVYALRKDAARADVLVAKDDSVLKRMPWARYTEPGGADYKRWKALQTHNAG